MKRDAAAFHGADELPEFVEPRGPEKDPTDQPLYGRLLGQFMRR